MRPIRLAVVDDSAFVRKALARIFEGVPAIRLVGTAASGEELLTHLRRWRPEVVTLDLSMPGMGGLATLDHILAWKRIPVLILSTHSAKDAPLTIEALHRGAVDFIDKQEYSLVDFANLRRVLVEKIQEVAGGAVAASEPQVRDEPPAEPAAPAAAEKPLVTPAVDVVLIGASTGGPPAIQTILESLASPFPLPVVVVQHMPEGFTAAFANRLNSILPLRVREAAHGDLLENGTVYVAAAGMHLKLGLKDGRLLAVRSHTPSTTSHCPSVDVLFSSAAALKELGMTSLAVLLTGMGRDGAEGLLELARAGCHTIAQSESTCLIYGMPRAAVELGAVREQLPLSTIARRVNEIAGRAAV